VIDFAVGELVLIEFSRSSETDVLMFLPILAWEAWAYWGGPGLLAGTTLTVLMGLANGWIERSLWHYWISVVDLVFWSVFLISMALIPLGLVALPQGKLEFSAKASLTPRETEVYQLAVENYSVKDIARTLNIEPNTVKTHLKSIYQKLGVSRTEELPHSLN